MREKSVFQRDWPQIHLEVWKNVRGPINEKNPFINHYQNDFLLKYKRIANIRWLTANRCLTWPFKTMLLAYFCSNEVFFVVLNDFAIQEGDHIKDVGPEACVQRSHNNQESMRLWQIVCEISYLNSTIKTSSFGLSIYSCNRSSPPFLFTFLSPFLSALWTLLRFLSGKGFPNL